MVFRWGYLRMDGLRGGKFGVNFSFGFNQCSNDTRPLSLAYIFWSVVFSVSDHVPGAWRVYGSSDRGLFRVGIPLFKKFGTSLISFLMLRPGMMFCIESRKVIESCI